MDNAFSRAVTIIGLALGGLIAPHASAQQIGEAFAIARIKEMSEHGGNGSSGSSYDRDILIERVTGVRDGGVELEYDLPSDTPAEERASNWQFPVRVFKPAQGSMQLLNEPELASRVDRWLARAKWPRGVCSHWIFTWNAFRIECEPKAVLDTLAAFDLTQADLAAGALYQDRNALAAAPLRQTATGPDGATYAAELTVDPEVIRRQQAEADVAEGEIARKPVSLDQALRGRADEPVSGTIHVTLEVGPNGQARRRTRVTNLSTIGRDGQPMTSTITETVERRKLGA